MTVTDEQQKDRDKQEVESVGVSCALTSAVIIIVGVHRTLLLAGQRHVLFLQSGREGSAREGTRTEIENITGETESRTMNTCLYRSC